jgi:hypothetical protein
MNMIRALLAGLLLVGLCWQQGASAQELPPGSYLRTCQDVELQGDTLVATCLRTDSSPQRTSLPRVQNCVGEIGNLNGALTCNYADSPAPPQPMTAAPQSPEEARETLMHLHDLCHQNYKPACIRFGFVMGSQHQAEIEEWHRIHPDWWWWERW